VKYPWLESLWMKLSGKENFYHISKKSIGEEDAVFYEDRKRDGRGKYIVHEDQKKASKICAKKGNGNRYMEIHTHPGEGVYPSGHDLTRLLYYSDRIKTMGIAQTDPNTGEVLGYGFYKMRKNTPSIDEIGGPIKLDKSSHEATIRDSRNKLVKYNIQCKMIPANGYRFDKNSGEFIKKDDSSYSRILKYAAIFFAVAGLALFVPGITGNAIGNLGSASSNFIGVLLFVVGIVGLFFGLKKK